MSRRASLLAKQEKRKPRVRFPDELVFLDNIKGNDIQACHSMLRRASVQLDLNGLDTSGLTPLHNAVLEGNLGAVQLLVQHGADINRQDADTWTPLHAACANGEADIARYLLCQGASKDIKTADGERPLDLCDARDFSVISVMLESDTARRARMLSAPDEGLEDDEDDDADNRNDSSGEEKDDTDSDDNSHSCADGHNKLSTICAGREDPSQPVAANDHRKNAQMSGLVAGMGKLKTANENNHGKHDATGPALKSSLKSPSSTSSSSTPGNSGYSRSTKSSQGGASSSSSSPTRKSPSSSPKVTKSPSTARKSPGGGVSPNTPRRSTANNASTKPSSNSSSPHPPASRVGADSREAGGGNSGRSSTNNSGSGVQLQVGAAPRTAKPPGHSILKKSTHHCHTVAE